MPARVDDNHPGATKLEPANGDIDATGPGSGYRERGRKGAFLPAREAAARVVTPLQNLMALSFKRRTRARTNDD